MIERRPFHQLAGQDHGWLKAKHHFSFADYRDATRMGWGSLRIWNDDEIAPNAGFPLHPHANMEIITYVREGAITHKDNLGNEGRTSAGSVQVMSAGTGIRHAEYNLEQQPTRIFQIWITPSSNGGSPAWGSQPFPKADRSGRFVTLASGFDNDNAALPIRARARVLGVHVEGLGSLLLFLRPRRSDGECSRRRGASGRGACRHQARAGAGARGDRAQVSLQAPSGCTDRQGRGSRRLRCDRRRCRHPVWSAAIADGQFPRSGRWALGAWSSARQGWRRVYVDRHTTWRPRR
jgi:quercetin 2,3-dioxygenase